MKLVLQMVGGTWAGVGALNVAMMFGNTDSSAVQSFGLMLNIILFVLPGLVVVGIGAILKIADGNAASPTMRGGGATGRT